MIWQLVKKLHKGPGSAVLRQRGIVVAILALFLSSHNIKSRRLRVRVHVLTGLTNMRPQCRCVHHGPIVGSSRLADDPQRALGSCPVHPRASKGFKESQKRRLCDETPEVASLWPVCLCIKLFERIT